VSTGLDIADLVRQAVAVVVATRDEECRPELGRAWAPVLSDDGTRLTLCVEAPAGSSMARNLQAGSPVAAMLARLTSQTTVQLKGQPIEVRAPTNDRLAAVREHVANFVAEITQVGVPEAHARALVGTDFVTVTIDVAERFDETPGPDAGREL
jgi:hypothetical protein